MRTSTSTRLRCLQLASLGLLLSGCLGSPTNAQLTLKVFGQPGITFNLTCTTQVADLAGRTQAEGLEHRGVITAEGIPLEFRLRGIQTYCGVHSEASDGSLMLELWREGVLVARSEREYDASVAGVGWSACGTFGVYRC